jgi:predicted ATPase
MGSFRDDEDAALATPLAQMSVLKLQRLSEENIAELTEAILGDAGRKADIVDFLHRETEGNVFFLLEIVRTLAEEAGQLNEIGSISLPQQVYTGGVKQIVQRRLSRLGAGARPLLTLAALAGRQLDLALLNLLAPDIDLEMWLTECANAALLEFQDGNWKFTHEKIREGIADDLSEAVLRDLYDHVAAAMEHLYADHPEQAGALAYQWTMAGDSAREYRYTVKAGQLTLRNGAYQEALGYFGRAIALGHEIRIDIFEWVYLNNPLAEGHLGLGNYEQAKQLYQGNLLHLDANEHGRELAAILSRLGDIDYALETFENATAYYQQGLALYRMLNDQHGIAKVLNSLGNVAYDMEDYAQATELYQESLAISRAIGARWGMAGSSGLGEATSYL